MKADGGWTEGDWHVVDGGRHWNNPAISNYRIHAASGSHGFGVAWSPDGELVAEHVYELADAQVMAAAKVLHAALTKARTFVAYAYSQGIAGAHEAGLELDAALAKARGESATGGME